MKTNKIQKDTKRTTSILKKLLATSSAFAVVSAVATGAQANNYVTHKERNINLISNKLLNEAIKKEGGKGPSNAEWRSGSSLKLKHNNVNITLGDADQSKESGINQLDLNGMTNVDQDGNTSNIQVRIDHDSTISSLIDSNSSQIQGQAAQAQDPVFADILVDKNKKLTLGDNNLATNLQGQKSNYSAIASIHLKDGANLEINRGNQAQTVLNGDIKGEDSFLDIKSPATFNGAVGEDGQNLTLIEVNANTVFARSVFANVIDIGECDVTLSADFTGNIETNKSGVLKINGNSTINGVVEFNEIEISGNANFLADVTGDISVARGGEITAKSITGSINMEQGGTANISGDIQGVVSLDGNAAFNSTANEQHSNKIMCTDNQPVEIRGNSIFRGNHTDVEGSFVLSTKSAEINYVRDVQDGVVLLQGGNLTMRDSNSNITISEGILKMRDAADVIVSGGEALINNISRSLIVERNTGDNDVNVHITNDITGHSGPAAITTENKTNQGKVAVRLANGNLKIDGEVKSDAAYNETDKLETPGVLVRGGSLEMKDISGKGIISNQDNITLANNYIIHDKTSEDYKIHELSGKQIGSLTEKDGNLVAEGKTLQNKDEIAFDAYTLNVQGGKVKMHDATNAEALILVTDGELEMNNALGAKSVVVGANKGKLTANQVKRMELRGQAAATVTKVESLTAKGVATVKVSKADQLVLEDQAKAEVRREITQFVNVGKDATLTFTGASDVNNINSEGKVIVNNSVSFKNLTKLDFMEVNNNTSVEFASGDIGNTIITTNQSNDGGNRNTSNITVNENQNILQPIGTETHSLGNIVLGKDNLTVNVGKDVFATIKSANSEKGIVNMHGHKVSQLGTKYTKLGTVNFENSAEVTNGLYAENVHVKNNFDATIGGQILVDNFVLDGAFSGVNIINGGIVDSNIQSASSENGGVVFAGDATINKDLGSKTSSLHTVEFADDDSKTVSLNANLYASNVEMKKSSVKLAKNVNISSKNTSINQTTLDLGSSTLTNNGNLTIEGNNFVNLEVSGNAENLSSGNIVVNGNINFKDGSKITLTPTSASIIDNAKFHKLTFITANNASKVDLSKYISVKGNPFQSWKVTSEGNRIILSSKDVSVDYMKKKLKDPVISEHFKKIDQASGTDYIASKEKILLSEIAAAEEKGEIKAGSVNEALDRITKANTGFSEAVSNDISGAESIIGARAISLRMPVIRTTANSGKITGVAAGDDSSKMGAWVNPFYSRISQGSVGEASGYKNSVYGASFGLDSKISEDSLLGVAFTASNSLIKHRGSKDGDKTRIKSLMLSVYNMYSLTDNWFANGSATLGVSMIRNSAKRMASGAANYEIAEGKYNLMSLSAKQMFGYNYTTEYATIAPMFGMKFSRVNSVRYKEKGASFQNLSISTKAANKLEAIAGMSVNGATYDVQDIAFTPEIHAFVNYNLFNKTQRPVVKLGSVEFDSKSKPQRVGYNLGLGLKSEYKAFEYEAGYDLRLAKKRVGHQGSLKVRLNF